MTRLFKRLAKSRSGAAAVEFAIIGPFLITAMLGVFQIGLGMQNYNALRAVSAEMARYTLINYQSGNPIDNTLIRLHGRALAKDPPYNLHSDLLEVTVTTVTTPRLADTMGEDDRAAVSRAHDALDHQLQGSSPGVYAHGRAARRLVRGAAARGRAGVSQRV